MENLLSAQEEQVLGCIQKYWDQNKEKISISNLEEVLKKDNKIDFKYERLRQIIESLWGKGELLIDVKGNERLIRPNHVSINSRSHPITYKNFTVIDEQTGLPTQRIWFSVYEKNKKRYVVISESRYNGGWKTTSNIIVPPEATDDFINMLDFTKKTVKNN